MIGLVDCNNFFVSVERVFAPELRQRPVAVLSSNDGCIIARSNDIKPFIPMGAPLFQVQDVVDERGVVLRSSNFALYSDMSARVMATLRAWSPYVEVYSIDEAFLEVNALMDLQAMKRAVEADTGIPISIGVGETKTLAKAANYVAKRSEGICNLATMPLSGRDMCLMCVPVGEVWGVGKRLRKKFFAHGIKSAYELASMPHATYRQYNVTVQRMIDELRGIPAPETGIGPSKSMVSSRSFGEVISSKYLLAEALSTHAANLGRKLRRERLFAVEVGVMLSSGKRGVVLSRTVRLPEATAQTQELVRSANQLLDTIYRQGLLYKKAGVWVQDLRTEQQLRLGRREREQAAAVDALLDEAARRWGRNVVQLGSEGVKQPWLPRHELRSPRYTSQWAELPRVL